MRAKQLSPRSVCGPGQVQRLVRRSYAVAPPRDALLPPESGPARRAAGGGTPDASVAWCGTATTAALATGRTPTTYSRFCPWGRRGYLRSSSPTGGGDPSAIR